jgi:hypothetical protein
MERENSIPLKVKIRRGVTPPLPEPPTITRSYSQKAAAFSQNALRDEIYRYILVSPELF